MSKSLVLFVYVVLIFPIFTWAANTSPQANAPASVNKMRFDDPANFSFTDTLYMAINVPSKDCEKLAATNPSFSQTLPDKKSCLFSRDSHVWGEVKRGELIVQREDAGSCEFDGPTKVVGTAVIAEQKSPKSGDVCTIVITRTGKNTVEVNTNGCADFCSGDARMDAQAVLNHTF